MKFHLDVRYIKDHIFTFICYASFGVAILVMLSILGYVVYRGSSAIIKLSFFIKDIPPPNMMSGAGGLRNAIIGSLMMDIISIVISAPVGILIATYIVQHSETANAKFFKNAIRFINDMLISTPTIIIGIFVYAIVVQPFVHFSGWASILALSIIAIPIVVRASEDVMYLVSPLLREAAVALAIPNWKINFFIIYRVAKNGLIVAVLLSFSRIAGETAPLLFTSLNNNFLSFNLNQSISSLPIIIYNFAMSSYGNWQQLAFGGALIIIVFILSVNLLARIPDFIGEK